MERFFYFESIPQAQCFWHGCMTGQELMKEELALVAQNGSIVPWWLSC